jgi:hypothetical protein
MQGPQKREPQRHRGTEKKIEKTEERSLRKPGNQEEEKTGSSSLLVSWVP